MIRTICLLPLWLIASAASPVPATEAWYRIIDAQGRIVGRQHERIDRTPDGVTVLIERDMAYRIEGHAPIRSSDRRVYGSDTAGHPLSLVIDSRENGRHRAWRVTIQADGAAIEARDGAGRVRSSRTAVTAGLPWGDPQSLLTGEWDQGPRFLLFDGSALSVVEARPDKAVDGRPMMLFWRAAFPVQAVIGDGTRATQPMLGTYFIWERVDVAVPDALLTGGVSIPHPEVTAPYAISRSALGGHIRYVFGLPATLREHVPATGEQAVRQEAAGVRVDICADCGPGLSTAPDDLDRWRRPAPRLESDAPELQAAVQPIMRVARGDRARMAALALLARRRLPEIDYAGHHSALQSWRRKRGDCTEDAVLLAALARAAGIPARVASGLVYSRERYHGASDAFMPHSWVLAYVDGLWRSFDISVGAFDASHIAFTIGDGDPQSIAAATQIAALVQWHAMAEVRTRPAS